MNKLHDHGYAQQQRETSTGPSHSAGIVSGAVPEGPSCSPMRQLLDRLANCEAHLDHLFEGACSTFRDVSGAEPARLQEQAADLSNPNRPMGFLIASDFLLAQIEARLAALGGVLSELRGVTMMGGPG